MDHGAHVVEWLDKRVWCGLWDVYGDHAQHVRDYYMAMARRAGFTG